MRRRRRDKKVDVLVMLARGYGDLNRWADAAHTYRDALAIAPNSPKRDRSPIAP